MDTPKTTPPNDAETQEILLDRFCKIVCILREPFEKTRAGQESAHKNTAAAFRDTVSPSDPR